MIYFLRPNIFGFKRIWRASEDTVLCPEPTNTARRSFLPSCTFGRRRVLVAR